MTQIGHPKDPVWRLIPFFRASGSVHMAIDNWLLEQHRQGLYPPTLRFYTWSPPAISLGYHQREWPSHWQQLTWQGQSLELVRRPTGGRAVLHQGDLTYAIVRSGLKGSRIQAYEQICEFLIRGWKSLGLDLHYGRAGKSYARNANCFATATGADLVTDSGVKFIGSAQLRRGDAILQHGSMHLNPDPELFARVFGKTSMPGDAPQITGAQASPTAIIEALTIAASDCFGVQWEKRSLCDTELEAALNWQLQAPQLPSVVGDSRSPHPDCGQLEQPLN